MKYLLSILILTNTYLLAQDQEPHLVGAGSVSSIYKIEDNEAITIKQLNQSQSPQHFKLLSSNGKLWGTTNYGGEFNKGLVFSINADGSGYEVVHEFGGLDGSFPQGGLIEFENRLWGLATGGGNYGNGVIYSLNPNGADYKVAKHFNLPDGAGPSGELTLSNGEMWGSTTFGGNSGAGTVFSFSPASGFQKRHDFSFEDGYIPMGTLCENNSRLWGTTLIGGLSFSGVIFSLSVDGSDFRVDHSFNFYDGANPIGGLLAKSDRLWGTTTSGIESGGSIFSIANDGSDFSILYDFQSNSLDKGSPREELLVLDEKFWGVSTSGGEFNFGYIYSINENGSGFTNHYSFKIAESDGRVPMSPLANFNDRIWGSTFSGGEFGNGVLFSLANDGTDYRIEHQFDDAEITGWWPNTDFIDEDDKIIGSTRYGGKSDCGVIYSMNKDGSDYSILHHFDLENGARPASIKKINGKLWGVTVGGGSFSRGTIFSMNIDGSGFEKRHDFDGINGASPAGYLVQSDDLLWGIAQDGNTGGAGSIFNFNPESGVIDYVHSFEFFTGADPAPGLLVANGKFWGTANGGNTLYGVIFTIDLNGNNYSVVHEFDSESGGNTRGPLVAASGKIWGVTDSHRIYSIDEDGSNYVNHQTIQGDLNGGLAVFENKLFGVANVSGGHSFVYSIDLNGINLKTELTLGPLQDFPQHGQTLQIINFPIVPVTGLPEAPDVQMIAYPNPATTNIFVELPRENLPVEIMLKDIYGRVFEQRIVSRVSQNSIESLDVSLLPSGLYIVTIQTSTGSKTARIIVK